MTPILLLFLLPLAVIAGGIGVGLAASTRRAGSPRQRITSAVGAVLSLGFAVTVIGLSLFFVLIILVLRLAMPNFAK
jgi:hypothetical protein